MTDERIRVEMPEGPVTANHPSIRQRILPAPLNPRLGHFAMRLAVIALDDGDLELVSIMQYALAGECTDGRTMGDLADRVLLLRKAAKLIGDKKMIRVLDAAVKNGC